MYTYTPKIYDYFDYVQGKWDYDTVNDFKNYANSCSILSSTYSLNNFVTKNWLGPPGPESDTLNSKTHLYEKLMIHKFSIEYGHSVLVCQRIILLYRYRYRSH